MTSTAKKMISIDAFLYEPPRERGEAGHLIGSRCGDCGGYVLPRKLLCPRCGGAMEVAHIPSTRGTLYSFTLNHQPMPGAVMEPPYIIAQVLLPEGFTLETVLTNSARFEALNVGAVVEMVAEKLREDDDGNDVMTFKFRPVQA